MPLPAKDPSRRDAPTQNGSRQCRVDGEPTEIATTYDALNEFMLEVQTYQYIEARYRNDPASLKSICTV